MVFIGCIIENAQQSWQFKSLDRGTKMRGRRPESRGWRDAKQRRLKLVIAGRSFVFNGREDQGAMLFPGVKNLIGCAKPVVEIWVVTVGCLSSM
jgi:hypothetical protein